MKNIILRDYQKNQLDFIQNRIDIADTVAVESPTGSGKTIVLLEFIKKWLSKKENALSNVIITTGFNNLVFLLEQRAKELGFDANNIKVLIGTKACNCPVKMKKAGLTPKVFTEKSYICGEEHKALDIINTSWNSKTCPFTKQFYSNYFQEITNNTGQIIIMNHSSFLVYQKFLNNCSLLVIDEAHTFTNFYDNYVKLELDKNDLSELDRAINNIKEPMRTIIKMNLSRNVELPSMQLDEIANNIENKTIKRKIVEFFETKPAFNNYIEKTENSFTIDKFYRSFDFDINPKILLTSATLDDFTLKMFNVRNANLYREYKTFCDYSKSEFLAIPNESYEKSLKLFMDYIKNKNLDSGLILSTTYTDMYKSVDVLKNYPEYRVFNIIKDSIKSFEKYQGKKILIGSRGLFQGIDIPNIKFVALNKIPFPNWNEKAKAQQAYLTNNGKNSFDPWKGFTLPKTENDIIQSTGRLWRSTDSFGVVSIFDSRIEKFKYIIKHTMDRYRHGININIMDEDGNISKFNV